MKELTEHIDKIDLNYRTQELVDQLEHLFKIITSKCSPQEEKLLREDFDTFIERGRFVILNTFAGGIIFLREPEVIEFIAVDFNAQKKTMDSQVKYGSAKRNPRNVKYKPNAGQIESTSAHTNIIFPHFFDYRKNIQLILLRIIGKLIKAICEHHKRASWFMDYKRDFDVNLSINGVLELTLTILA